MYTRAAEKRSPSSIVEPVVVATGRPVGMAKSNAGDWRRPNALTHGGRSSKGERERERTDASAVDDGSES